MYDVLIIGSGPAGLTAAIYAARASLKTLMLAGEKSGGQLMLTTTVENYPGFPKGIAGPELMQAMRKQAEQFGAEVLEKNVKKVDFEKQPFKVFIEQRLLGDENLLVHELASFAPLSGARTARPLAEKMLGGSLAQTTTHSQILSPAESLKAKAVIIATGADARWLNISGEKRLIGKGVSSCAPCDAFFFKDKRVIVVGGGDSAMEEVLVLTKFAREVTIVHRRDEFRASQILQEKVFANPKIKILWNAQIVEILGKEKVQGVRLKTHKSHKTHKTYEKNIDGVFVAIGHKPNTEIFRGQVKLDEKGYVKRVPTSNFQFQTSITGVFVAGDVHDYHYRQAVTAAGFGCMAALEVEKWLEERK